MIAPTFEQIEYWEKIYNLAENTGVLTHRTPALDIDIMDPDAARAVEDLAREWFEERGETFLVRVGEAPKRAIVFQTDAPFSKQVRNVIAPNGAEYKIELLASGQQIVVSGIHPKTGQPYSWHGGELATTAIDDLPYINLDIANRFLDAAVQLLVKQCDYRAASERPMGNGQDDGERNPADWGYLIDNIHVGRELHDSTIALAAKLIASGMADGAAVNFLRGLYDKSIAPKDQRFRERYDDIPRAVASARKKFAPPPPPPPPPPPQPGDLGEWDAGDDPGPIPPRQWLLGNQFCRGFISSVVAAGGGGKTALRTLQFISLATGRELCGQHVFRRGRVLVISLEDDRNEMQRRLTATLKHYNIPRSELKGWLFYATPRRAKLAIRKGKNDRSVGPLEAQIRAAIERRKPDLISFDPFIKTHSLEENDSGDMDFVCAMLTDLGIEYNIAVDSPHHVHKGTITPGDADSGRGSSGIRDAGRLVYTLATMSEAEAKQFNIPLDARWQYVRLDSAKVNIAAPAGKATWFKLVGVPIGNATAEYPNGDTVQVVEPWIPPVLMADMDIKTINWILNAIAKGMPNGQRYSSAPSATTRAAWKKVQDYCPNKSDGQCREIIKAWVKSGLLCTRDYDDPVRRDTVEGLFVDDEKRPDSSSYVPQQRATPEDRDGTRVFNDGIIGPEPDASCAQCRQKDGVVYLVRSGVGSVPLHEHCIPAWKDLWGGAP